MKNKIQLVTIALFVLGIAFIINALQLYFKNQSIKAKYEKTKAVVSEIAYSVDSTFSYPILQFKTIDNQRVRIRAMKDKLSLNKGDTVELYYDIINPEAIYLPTQRENAGFFVMSIFGILISLPAILYFSWQWRNNQKFKQLKSQGKKISAKITQVQEATQGKLFGVTPYIVYCEGGISNYNGAKKSFKSGRIWANPTEFLGEDIDIYIDAVNSDVYVVDLSFLPNEIIFEY
jgi:hypothetical protein